MTRRLALLLCAIQATATAGVAAQVRPLPRDSRVRVFQLPELEIVEVRRFGDREDVIRINQIVPVEVVVRNTGNGSAVVRAGTPDDRAGRSGTLIRYGPVRTIGPGQTVSLPLELEATGNRFRGDRFETDVFLFQPPAAEDPPYGRLFADGNDVDNQYKTSFAFDRPRIFDVLGTLDGMFIYDKCDTASDGDWFVHFGLAEMRGDVIVQKVETYWPAQNSPTNLVNRENVEIDRLLRLTGVGQDSEILLSVSAVDCDADSPLAWPLTEPAAALTDGIAPPSIKTGLGQAVWEFGVGCTGEEIWEASGGHDKAGAFFYRVPPARWQARSEEPLAHTSYEPQDCSDSPSPAYRPTVRVDANAR